MELTSGSESQMGVMLVDMDYSSVSRTVSYTHLDVYKRQAKHPTKKVWLNIYNASDNFLSSTYQPLLQKYDDLLNLDVEYIGGCLLYTSRCV